MAEKVTELFEKRIKVWIDAECEKDAQFAETVKNSKKTVEGACNYVLKCARDSKRCGFDDAEVYGMVRHFFDESDVKDPGKVAVQRIIVSGKVELSQEQIEAAKEEARKQFYNEIKEAEEKKRKEAAEKERQRKAEIREKRIAEQSAQMDLFGF